MNECLIHVHKAYVDLTNTRGISLSAHLLVPKLCFLIGKCFGVLSQGQSKPHFIWPVCAYQHYAEVFQALPAISSTALYDELSGGLVPSSHMDTLILVHAMTSTKVQ